MGRRRGKREDPGMTPRNHCRPTMREEAIGKQKQTNNAKSILKLKHLQNLAIWASRELSIPSLAAFYGRQFAACGEAFSVPPDPSLFPCQRCETILQPGFNCKVRIEKNQAKKLQHGKKRVSSIVNNVVYTCGFCSHRNVMRGTSKGHVRVNIPLKAKPPPKPESTKSTPQTESTMVKATVTGIQVNNTCGEASPEMSKSSETSFPETPLAKPRATLLLDSKRKKRRTSVVKKTADSESSVATIDAEKISETSRKKRRKSWTTLKEITQSSERERSKTMISVSSIPFLF
ncbi:hypothetical protein Dimus_035119 [Dionaea muscipula]